MKLLRDGNNVGNYEKVEWRSQNKKSKTLARIQNIQFLECCKKYMRTIQRLISKRNVFKKIFEVRGFANINRENVQNNNIIIFKKT